MNPTGYPLTTPVVERMPGIERQLAERETLDKQAQERIAELQRRYDEVHQREEQGERSGELERDPERQRELAELVEERSRELSAVLANTIMDNTTMALRDEWMQLQVVRSLMPLCAVCERGVGAVHFQLGSRGRVLCLDCFDAWADPALDALEEDTPASFQVDQLAEEARERESSRRQALVEEHGPQLRIVGAGEVPQEAEAEQRCWHCGGSVDRRPVDERALVVLRVMALGPNSTQPEEGHVCLACLDWGRDASNGRRWSGS